MEEMKICTECGTEKPMTEEFFHKNPDYACGFGNKCKVCVNKNGQMVNLKRLETKKIDLRH